MRWIHHLFLDHFAARRAFPAATLKAIEQSISMQEKRHRGELRFVVEGGLPLGPLVVGRSARERAIEVFSRLRIWDTEDNAGVLVYLLLADRRVEIVADRGIHAKVGTAAWDAISASKPSATCWPRTFRPARKIRTSCRMRPSCFSRGRLRSSARGF